jgi:hypothetical protein
MEINHYVYEIESMRIEKKINQEVFLKDIVSDRQYRRYLNHESVMTLDIFLKLLQRLDYDMATFLVYVDQKQLEEKKPLMDIRSAIIDFDYDKAKTWIHALKKRPQTKDIDALLTLYLKLIDFYEKLDLNKDSDNQKVSAFLKETDVLDALNETYFSADKFSSINLLMNKIFNRVEPIHQKAFLDFYSDFIEGKKIVLDGDTMENIQMFYSYFCSATFGRSYISEDEAEKGGRYIKDAIQLTRETLMTYNLMALNYLNSSVCYLHKLNEDAKKSLFYTLMSVIATGNHQGIFPSFKLAFGDVVSKENLLRDFKDELQRHLEHDTHYYEEAKTYNDLSTCAG